MKKFDVIIVGCGPAGATAGYLLGASGINTLMIDKSDFPRRKLCGGGLTHKTLGLLNRVFQETRLSLQNAGIIESCSYEYDIYFRNRLLVHGVSQFPILFVDRYVYDDFLLQKARNTGVTVIEGDKVMGFDPDTNQISTSSGRVYQARFIIGADGAQSVIRKHLPGGIFSMKKWEYNLATALETFIPRADLGKAPEHPAIYFGYADWGYSWVFPNKDRLILGLGALNRKSAKQIKDIFINYINAISHVYSFDASKGMKISGYPVPSGNYLKRPYYKSTLLAGDAAGFADPISGEGIYQAQRSAEIASICIRRALKDGIPIEVGYKELLHRYVFPDLLHARVLRWFVFNAMNKLNFNYINMLTQKGEKRALDIVHGLRTYRFLQLARGIHGDIA